MATTATGTSTHDEQPPPAPLRFDRRQHDRWPLEAAATACRVSGERFGEMFKLKTRDCSGEGLGAVCSKPIEPGAAVSVTFQTPGFPSRPGVVLWCRPCGDGYRLAIRFESRLAA